MSSQMIRFAKILEYDNHQFLIRACHHPALVGVPHLDDPTQFKALLTIDTEQSVAPETGPPTLMRLVVNCQKKWIQEKCFQLINELHCMEVLRILQKQAAGALTDFEFAMLTTTLQEQLIEQALK